MKETYPNISACDPRTCTNSMVRSSGRIISNIYRKHLAPFNITSSQLSILFVTEKAGPLNQAAISRILKLDKSTLNRNLVRLLDSSFIEKHESRSIGITTKGKRRLEKIIPAWEEAKAEVNDLIGEDGLAALKLLKQKLHAS